MAIVDEILKTLDPKITPPSITIPDLESKNEPGQRAPESAGYVQQLGKSAPLIKIGNTVISPDLILAFSVQSNSIVPTIHLAILDPIGTFTSVNYPRTSLLITAFVAATHPKLKSFAQSFIITNTVSMPIGESAVRYDFTGELYVPNLNGNFIKSYNSKTSGSTLKEIAADLRLGFATNEDSMNDTMTWINPNLNYKSFIKHVTDHAYKNEKSFFDCFIDRYYILNFVNVEKQFAVSDTISEGYSSYSQSYIDSSRTKIPDQSYLEDSTVPLILTNSVRTVPTSDLRIVEFAMLGENGRILNTDGFRKRTFTYKHGEDSPVKDWFVEPISNPVSPSGPVHQTPDLEDYTKNEIVKWMGTDYGNAHANYKFAKIINSHNKLETEKNMLQIKVLGFNQNILRGSRVRVDIYSDRAKDSNDKRMSDTFELTDTNRQDGTVDISTLGQNVEILDNQLSDFYYVKEITYSYNPVNKGDKFTTTMVLSRRNWLPSPKNEITV